MAIQLTEAHLTAIRHHGERTFPHECCGFILGRQDNGAKSVTSLSAADNARENTAQHNRFLITAEMYLAADKEARVQGLDILGFYHSHPNAPARPSEYDREHAWAWYSYVIVSIQDGSARDLTSWVLRDDRSAFDPEDIVEH